jgi:hypothetical protein
VMVITKPTLKGFWKLSDAMTVLRPVFVRVITTGVICVSCGTEGAVKPPLYYFTLAAAADIKGIP